MKAKWLLPIAFVAAFGSKVRADQLYRGQFGGYKVEVAGKLERGKEVPIEFVIEGKPYREIGCIFGGPDDELDIGQISKAIRVFRVDMWKNPQLVYSNQ
jgi:hypothetical protein